MDIGAYIYGLGVILGMATRKPSDVENCGPLANDSGPEGTRSKHMFEKVTRTLDLDKETNRRRLECLTYLAPLDGTLCHPDTS